MTATATAKALTQTMMSMVLLAVRRGPNPQSRADGAHGSPWSTRNVGLPAEHSTTPTR
jgi:hypothetical protein